MNMRKQKGVSSLLIVSIVGMIAALWVSSQNAKLISKFKSTEINRIVQEKFSPPVKEKLLQYALLFGSKETVSFPCPDTNYNGITDADENSDAYCNSPLDLASFDETSSIDQGIFPMLYLGEDAYVPAINDIFPEFYFTRPKQYFYYVLSDYTQTSLGKEKEDYTQSGSIWMNPNKEDIDNLSEEWINDRSRYAVLLINPGDDGKIHPSNRLDSWKLITHSNGSKEVLFYASGRQKSFDISNLDAPEKQQYLMPNDDTLIGISFEEITSLRNLKKQVM